MYNLGMNNLSKSFVFALLLYGLLLAIGYILYLLWQEQKPQEKFAFDLEKLKLQELPQTPAKEPSTPPTPPQKKSTPPPKLQPPTPPPAPTTPPLEPTEAPQTEATPPPNAAPLPTPKPTPPTTPSSAPSLTHSILANLPKPAPTPPHKSPQRQLIEELYEEESKNLTAEQEAYLEEHLLQMQSITQNVLNRIGQLYLDPRFHYYNYNYVEFMLHPDGSISDLQMIRQADFVLLDKITQETIETAYKDYPHPQTPIKIRFKFLYDLRAY